MDDARQARWIDRAGQRLTIGANIGVVGMTMLALTGLSTIAAIITVFMAVQEPELFPAITFILAVIAAFGMWSAPAYTWPYAVRHTRTVAATVADPAKEARRSVEQAFRDGHLERAEFDALDSRLEAIQGLARSGFFHLAAGTYLRRSGTLMVVGGAIYAAMFTTTVLFVSLWEGPFAWTVGTPFIVVAAVPVALGTSFILSGAVIHEKGWRETREDQEWCSATRRRLLIP